MTQSIGADFIKFRRGLGDTWRGFTRASKVLIVFMAIISLPFLIESAVWIIAISVLIPLCFLFGVIKHHVPILWIILLFLINLGSLADLAADVWILGKILVMYITKNVGMDFENEIERNLFLSRLIITLATGLPGIIIFYTAMGLETKQEAEARIKSGKKKTSTGHGDGLLAIVMIIAWKLLMAVMRVVLLVKIIISAVKHKKITNQVEYSIQYIEAFLSIDVLCAAIPLGILTALEIFVYSHHRGFSPGEVYELIKLVSLAIDLVGLAYLYYFEIFGLERCTGSHHEEHLDETRPIINEPSEFEPKSGSV